MKTNRRKYITTTKEMITAIREVISAEIKNEDIVYVCIGTDRSTGDCLGPYVGMQLEKKGYRNVYGTIDNPTHAMNLNEVIDSLPKDKYVLAIDACLGQSSSVGTIAVAEGPLHPGAGVQKELPKVGDYNIHGVVNVGGFMEYFVLQNTRLSLVMNLGDIIVDSLVETFPLETNVEVFNEIKIS